MRSPVLDRFRSARTPLSGIAQAESPPAAWAFDLLRQVNQWQLTGPLDFLPSAMNTLNPAPANNMTARRRIESHQRLTPIYFEPNIGQVAEDVRFLARGPSYTLFLTANEAVLALQGKAVIRTQLEGATRNPEPQMEGLEKLPGISNYFLGNDPAKWRTKVPHYQQVRYADVYPGVDMVYYGNPNQLEHDFIVAPGVDPSVIQLAISGAEQVRVNTEGDLVLAVPGGEIVQQAPRIYQVIDGRQEAVAGRYVLRNENLADTGTVQVAVVDPVIEALQVRFEIAQYDQERPLVIDPVLKLDYSTYLGGILNDYGTSIAVDNKGNAYVTGATASINFPITLGAFDSSLVGVKTSDAFVSKFSFSSLIYSTYLGGIDSNDDKDDISYDIVVDDLQRAYITGTTASVSFPYTPPPYVLHGPGGRAPSGGKDAFIAVLDSTGSSLLFSTHLGGTKDDEGRGIALRQPMGLMIYVAGYTNSTDFPLVSSNPLDALQPRLLGGTDVFVSQIDTGGTLWYSTYLGGDKDDKGMAIARDSNDNVYITGSTKSANFPITGLAFDTTLGGSEDGFIAKIDPDPSKDPRYSLIYSAYLGGSSTDSGTDIAVDSNFHAYVTGVTASSDFPIFPITSNVAQSSYGGNKDAFITKIDPDPTLIGLHSLLYSSYLGGNKADSGASIAVIQETSGAIRTYVTGATASSDFPVTSDAQDDALGGTSDAFIAQISQSGDRWLYVTYLGGDNDDVEESGTGIAANKTSTSNGDDFHVYITGVTDANDFPVTSNAYYPINNNNKDVFVTKLDDLTPATFLITHYYISCDVRLFSGDQTLELEV
ncbi:MAG: SBBP repeat-containing protein [Gammaproteobacteria bacterium]|nr:SBBP repeat-containing protein [Gammaproteobacteria bacterium]